MLRINRAAITDAFEVFITREEMQVVITNKNSSAQEIFILPSATSDKKTEGISIMIAANSSFGFNILTDEPGGAIYISTDGVSNFKCSVVHPQDDKFYLPGRVGKVVGIGALEDPIGGIGGGGLGGGGGMIG